MRNYQAKNQSKDSETFVSPTAEVTSVNSPNQTVIRATLFHLNGETSQIVMFVPFYTSWSEPYEEAAILLEEYVNRLTRFWVQIAKFKVDVGTILPGNTFNPLFSYREKDIPLEKVFKGGERGKWLTEKEMKVLKYS
ncbi:hypothetical protein WG906_09755 [Pedobacter sp. P351]|uniref:hypothetical protein n=1 Tax=Pedobacter superstes TaxID=3133441 RepID=UPI0030AFF95E